MTPAALPVCRSPCAKVLAYLLLFAPVPIFYAGHFTYAARQSLVPTGFVQDDQPYYMANAREHFDAAGRFHLFYGNPFSADVETPRIYFQPAILVLGVARHYTGLAPGAVLAMFGFVAGLAAVWAATALYEQFVGLGSAGAWLGLLGFVWGGGLFVVGGLGYVLFSGLPLSRVDVLTFDPFEGWWFFNLGRNLVLPLEAFYHFLFLSCLLAVMIGRFATAWALLAVLAASHPFTGTQALLTVAAWVAVERLAVKSSRIPFTFIAGLAALCLAHFSYYLLYLPSYPEHRSVMSQWTLAWTVPWTASLLGYGLVAAAVLWRIRRPDFARQVFANPDNRLLLALLVVSLALENHDLVMTPHQPLHFARGYSWVALFLLGASVWVGLFDRLTACPLSVARGIGLVAVLALLLADNAAWLGVQTVWDGRGIYLSRPQAELLSWLRQNAPPGALLVSDDIYVCYLATTYTPLRSWRSHPANTPFSDRRREDVERYFASGKMPSEWEGRPLVVVCKTPPATSPGTPVVRFGEYSVYLRPGPDKE
jgi:hypothetical protein